MNFFKRAIALDRAVHCEIEPFADPEQPHAGARHNILISVDKRLDRLLQEFIIVSVPDNGFLTGLIFFHVDREMRNRRKLPPDLLFDLIR
jgi:hypothetical protein